MLSKLTNDWMGHFVSTSSILDMVYRGKDDTTWYKLVVMSMVTRLLSWILENRWKKEDNDFFMCMIFVYCFPLCKVYGANLMTCPH